MLFLLGILLIQEPIARYVPSAPDARHVFVLDSAHLLSAATIAALQDSARALQTETGADVAWVTLPTLGGRPIEEAALYIGRTWRIGSAGKPGDPLRNRGLVVLYVPDRTKTAGPNFRIEVGNGLEGTITDSRSRTITNAMREDLRAKRYDAAYLAGWTVAARLVREDVAARATGALIAAQKPPESAAAKRSLRAIAFVVVAVVGVIGVGIIVLIVFIVRHQSRRGGARRKKHKRRHRSSAWAATSSSSWSSSDSGSSGSDSSSSSGGDFGGGGGFSGGGSSDSI